MHFFFCRQEMYPPKVAEFAFLTDGACTDKEILDLELVLLKVRALYMFYEINVYVHLYVVVHFHDLFEWR